MAPIENVDISSAAFKANPYPFYAKLRDQAPVHPIILADKRTVWLVTRYEDVLMVLKDDRFVKDKRRRLDAGSDGEGAVDSENAQAASSKTCSTLTCPITPGCAGLCTWRSRRGWWRRCASASSD